MIEVSEIVHLCLLIGIIFPAVIKRPICTCHREEKTDHISSQKGEMQKKVLSAYSHGLFVEPTSYETPALGLSKFVVISRDTRNTWRT
jgi:hypothetical protein